MKSFLTKVASLVLSLSSGFSFADSELDRDVANQEVLARDLPRSLVVRIDERTRSVAVLHSDEFLRGSVTVLDETRFVPVTNSDIMRGELDRDSSTSGWYFYWHGYNYFRPTYYYGGFNFHYRPYYSYHWNNCNYFWYRW